MTSWRAEASSQHCQGSGVDRSLGQGFCDAGTVALCPRFGAEVMDWKQSLLDCLRSDQIEGVEAEAAPRSSEFDQGLYTKLMKFHRLGYFGIWILSFSASSSVLSSSICAYTPIPAKPSRFNSSKFHLTKLGRFCGAALSSKGLSTKP